ncbi:hypothetical protein B0H17DRAFT_1151499 [Mycena rosella]|uniref:Uncharacterized protein n=1 Tax=Mycena rosella TaxID=1033263 RepID=A0AAD7FIT9_MYCRO|nr:hypothetical protein B0H17DRAFT_1151499 [Mycena rosella]
MEMEDAAVPKEDAAIGCWDAAVLTGDAAVTRRGSADAAKYPSPKLRIQMILRRGGDCNSRKLSLSRTTPHLEKSDLVLFEKSEQPMPYNCSPAEFRNRPIPSQDWNKAKKYSPKPHRTSSVKLRDSSERHRMCDSFFRVYDEMTRHFEEDPLVQEFGVRVPNPVRVAKSQVEYNSCHRMRAAWNNANPILSSLHCVDGEKAASRIDQAIVRESACQAKEFPDQI